MLANFSGDRAIVSPGFPKTHEIDDDKSAKGAASYFAGDGFLRAVVVAEFVRHLFLVS